MPAATTVQPTTCLGVAHVRPVCILNFKIQYISNTMFVFNSVFIVVFYSIRRTKLDPTWKLCYMIEYQWFQVIWLANRARGPTRRLITVRAMTRTIWITHQEAHPWNWIDGLEVVLVTLVGHGQPTCSLAVRCQGATRCLSVKSDD
jgi:hypothetical protein